jgi:hypothetical protein
MAPWRKASPLVGAGPARPLATFAPTRLKAASFRQNRAADFIEAAVQKNSNPNTSEAL